MAMVNQTLKTRPPDRVLILPVGWREVDWHVHTQRVYTHVSGLKVIAELESHDSDWWLHVSCSHAERIPRWDDVRLVKDTFVGRDNKAVMILPPESEYVNDHPHVLHMYYCVSRDPLPDFRRREGGRISL